MINKYIKIHNNRVIDSIVCDDETIKKYDGSWIKANGIGIGYEYNKEADKFLPLQPSKSYILNKDKTGWELSQDAVNINNLMSKKERNAVEEKQLMQMLISMYA